MAEDALPSFEVTSTDKAFATEFAVPQRITVPSNGQRVTLALGSYTAPATLITRTAPGYGRSRLPGGRAGAAPGVWPVGHANLYRDGAFVGHRPHRLCCGHQRQWHQQPGLWAR